MMKELDLSKSVYDLTETHPELLEILPDLGFIGIKNPVVRNTMGRKLTIPQGCKKMNIDCGEVIHVLEGKGFKIIQ